MSLGPIPGLRERIVTHWRWIKRRDHLDSELAFHRKYPEFSQHQANDWFSDDKKGVPTFENLVKLSVVFGVTWQELLVGVAGAKEIQRTQKPIRVRRAAEEKALQQAAGTEHLQTILERKLAAKRQAAG